MTVNHLSRPLQAVTEVLQAHGITPDRYDVLQDGNTLVVRLTETIVARVVQDLTGPRATTEWFEREIALAQHLTSCGAPVIPLHFALPAGPHLHRGYPMNFWQFVTRTDLVPEPAEIGRVLKRCHEALADFSPELPRLGIITESICVLDKTEGFEPKVKQMLHQKLTESLETLADLPHQPLHGDAHPGNLMQTTMGLLLTDWEDAFSGPVEWDVASLIWNAQILDGDYDFVEALKDAYGPLNVEALEQCLVARAAVMTAWYPTLYPHPDASRREKLQRRIEWLAGIP